MINYIFLCDSFFLSNFASELIIRCIIIINPTFALTGVKELRSLGVKTSPLNLKTPSIKWISKAYVFTP